MRLYLILLIVAAAVLDVLLPSGFHGATAIYPVLLVAGAAMAAAGAGASMAAGAKSEDAMDDARNAERIRQQSYQQQSDAAYQVAAQKANAESWKEGDVEGTKNRKKQYAKLEGQSLGTSLPIGGKRNQVVNSPVAQARDQASAANNAWSRLVGDAQARLGGGDDANIARSIQANRTTQQIRQVGQNARRSANLLNYDLEDASHAGDDLATAGQILSSVGMVAGSAGAAGYGPMIGGNPWNNLASNPTIFYP